MASETPTENGLFPDSTPQKKETRPLSSPQFLEELMQIHDRRNPREPSLKSSSSLTSSSSSPVSPPSTPRTPPVTPPLLLSPASETRPLSSPQFLVELKQKNDRRNPREPSLKSSSPLNSSPSTPVSPPSTPRTPPVTLPLLLSPASETRPLSSPQFLVELKQKNDRRNPREPSLKSSSPLNSSPSTPVSPPSTPRTPPVTLPLLLSPASETRPLSSPQFLVELMQKNNDRRNPREPSLKSSSPLTSSPSTPVSPPSTPRTPPVTPPLLLSPASETGLALSSPELLSELKHPRSLRHIKPQRGLTTVFSGRGRVSQGPAQVHSSGKSPNPRSPEASTGERRESAGRRFLANGTQR